MHVIPSLPATVLQTERLANVVQEMSQAARHLRVLVPRLSPVHAAFYIIRKLCMFGCLFHIIMCVA